ncbi:hypothetical protein [Streptomyces cinereoruber]|uniref:hypothetical protein n=1 Tax=Streptomyces cinereoruber TaxID=67260 RepID=UPI00362FBDEF
MTHPNTPAPAPAATDGSSAAVVSTPVETIDQALADRAASHGEYLAGLIARAELDVVGQPTKLPALLFPDIAPDDVDQVWRQALAVGYRLGRIVERPDWDAAGIQRLRNALTEAGYRQMARQVDRSRAVTRPHQATPSQGAE